MNMSRHHHRLNSIYEIAGFSKQSHCQYMERRKEDEQKANQVINAILMVREFHSLMGLKKIYKLISPNWIGRDRFIEIGMEHGYGIKKIKNYQRTTFSSKSAWFVNLTAGLPITGINQVWVSDITYYRIHRRCVFQANTWLPGSSKPSGRSELQGAGGSFESA